jgi:hypothetical protein
VKEPANAAIATPSTTTTGTANKGTLKRNPKNTTIRGKTNNGTESAAAGTPSVYLSNTPASMAAAMGAGICAMARASGLSNAAKHMSSPETTKAPSAFS